MTKVYVRKAATYENIKQVYSDRGRGFPFSEFRIEGKHSFRNTGDAYQLFVKDENGKELDDKEYLLLEDKDQPFGISSGAVKLVVAPNWRVKLWIGTDNNNYWKDNSELENIVQRSGLDRQDVIIATLTGNDGDYLSIDIDQAYSGINNFSLRVGGVMRNNSERKDIDDEVRIAILEAYYLEEPQDEVQGPLEEGGQGDLDNDGVPDGEDEDPYDPDIQEEGDVDDDPVDPEINPPQPPKDDDEDDDDDDDDGGDETVVDNTLKVLGMALVLSLVGYLVFIMVRRAGGGDLE